MALLDQLHSIPSSYPPQVGWVQFSSASSLTTSCDSKTDPGFPLHQFQGHAAVSVKSPLCRTITHI